ncbi:phosphate transport system permease protein [Clostridium moniliforme]|uniref:Phosphate transport system permease protein n=1 Tax=Clostridium moniliforme TaxID=39489 RepID=A0ABS4F0D5_9CLOT|nr:phosphate ABC transporter permease subunit PstC [Clostridium moniliforme]MBP1889713.1 phosphate transport system permease protein [Clostridium moniliforme]
MNLKDKLFRLIIKLIAILSLSIIALIIIFIFKESIKLFKEYSFTKFIFSKDWNPLGEPPELGILPMILSTLYISFLAILIATPISTCAALYISFFLNKKYKKLIHSFISILAGIPSIVYGFIGLLVVVKFIEVTFNRESGESVLAGAIVLAIMIIPYIIGNLEESFSKIYKKYGKDSNSLGVSKNYMILNLILPSAKRSVIASIVLSLGRAMGETMAVMMVIGNAPLMPKLLGKAETIPSLLALEVGSAELKSLHYYGLYASGFILMVVLIIINIVFQKIKNSVIEE